MSTFSYRQLWVTAALLPAVLFSSARAAPDFEQSVLVFGGEASYPPFEWRDDGRPTGFNVDLQRAIAEAGKVKIEHRLGDWPDVIQALESGSVDVVAMFHLKEREKDFRFTKPFAFVNHAIFGLAGTPGVTAVDRLGEATVAVERLSYAYLRLQKESAAQLLAVASTVEALDAVLQRRADYAILSAPAANYLIESRDLPLYPVGSPLWPAEYAFAVRKDREDLAAWLDARLSEVVASGRYSEIETRWQDRMMPADRIGRMMSIAAMPLAVAVLLGGFWLWSIRRRAISSAAQLTDESRMRLDAEQRLSWAADHNPETGMPSQHRFLRLAAQHLSRHARDDRKHIVVAIKLADLEQTIRTYGHDAGLALVRQFARRIEAAGFPASGQLGRDVFAVFGDKVAIDREFKEQLSLRDTVVRSIASPRIFAGAATWPQHGESLAELLRRAETALSTAIQRQEDWVDFRPAMEPDAADLELIASFREQGASLIYPVFQPQIDLKSGKVVAAEALARWRSGRQVPPNVFIPLLEGAGLISQVTRRMVVEGMRVGAQLRGMGYRCPISVNVTGKDMLGWKLSRSILKAARKYAGLAADIKLELTETGVVDRPELLQWKMRRLVKEGIAISVDDFGTGYSSLAYLSQFPVKEIKIDQSFVRDMVCNDKHMRIVTSTIAMGHELGLAVVAEGVETEEALNVLRRAGCDRAQGYGISRPLPETDFMEFVTRNSVPERKAGSMTRLRSVT